MFLRPPWHRNVLNMNHSPQTSCGKYLRAGLTIQSRTKKLFIKRVIMHKTCRRQQTIQAFMVQWPITLQPKANSIASTIKMFWNRRCKHVDEVLAKLNLCTSYHYYFRAEDDKSIRHEMWLLVACDFPQTTSECATTTTPIYLVVQRKV